MKNQENGKETYSLKMNADQTLHRIQDEFNHFFPFLKLEFIQEEREKGSGYKNLIITNDENISRIQKKINSMEMFFNKFTTVKELENIFSRDFGINVKVFRKSGNIWLVTDSTDNWSLEQQNEEGRSLAAHLKIDPPKN